MVFRTLFFLSCLALSTANISALQLHKLKKAMQAGKLLYSKYNKPRRCPLCPRSKNYCDLGKALREKSSPEALEFYVKACDKEDRYYMLQFLYKNRNYFPKWYTVYRLLEDHQPEE